MGIARNNRKTIRKSNTQATVITKEKTPVLNWIPKSKVVLKSAKSATNASLRSKEVARQLRKRKNAKRNNNADKRESRRDKNRNMNNVKGASKNFGSNAFPSKARVQHGARTENGTLRSGLKRKFTKNDDGEQSGRGRIESVKRVSAAKKQKLLKIKVRHAKEIERKSEDACEKDLSKDHILQCINAIFHLTQEKLESKTDIQELFAHESQPIFMQVTCVRIPKAPRRHMRILLPHSIISPEDDIALFVCDLERGRRKDFEPTKEHYEDLLKAQGFTRRITIIPMNQVKTEYDQFELKRKLAASYDHFFVDGRISGHITHMLGSEFFKRRKLPVSIKMSSKDLKREIEWAMRKTTMRLHSDGDSHTVQVANTSMEKEDILENILAVCKNIAKNYPGHWANIRALRIKTPLSLAIPIFYTLKNKNTVRVPVVKPKRPKAYCIVEGELTNIYGNATVAVTPEGDVTVTQKLPKRRFRDQES